MRVDTLRNRKGARFSLDINAVRTRAGRIDGCVILFFLRWGLQVRFGPSYLA